MRPRTMVITVAAAGVLALTAVATVAAATATGPSQAHATHHGINVQDMATMHDAITDAHPGMGPHMTEHGIDPGQMRDWMVEGVSPDQMYQRIRGGSD